jgi:hypothetical protein
VAFYLILLTRIATFVEAQPWIQLRSVMKIADPMLGIRISPEIDAGLKELAAREGESVSTIVRATLRNAIARARAGVLPPLGVEAQPQLNDREHARA